MSRPTVATPIVDKNGKVTTVHRAVTPAVSIRISDIQPRKDDESTWATNGNRYASDTMFSLERYIDEWGMDGNDDPFDSSSDSKSEYLIAANELTRAFGKPRLGGTRAVWDMGDYVAKLAFNDVGMRASEREAEASASNNDIPVANCYFTDEFDAPVLIMEKVEEIRWGYEVPGQEHINENDYPWLDDVEADQAGITADGRVVAFDLGEFWDGI